MIKVSSQYSLNFKNNEDNFALTEEQKIALCKILMHIGSWTNSRFDQHLRYEINDEDANIILKWIEINIGLKVNKL